jgi:hypothetical protein
MKRITYLGLMFLILSGLSACTSYDYYTAGLNKTHLSQYHTFAWMPVINNGNKMNNSVADAKIKDAATTSLETKGLTLQQKHPDLIVSYTATVGRGTRTTYYTNYGGYPGWGWGGGFGWGGSFGWGGWGGWGGGFGWGFRPSYYAFGGPFAYSGGLSYADQEHYKEGTLIIDLIDRRTKKVIWRGYGVGEVHHDPQKNVDDIPKVVDGILKQLVISPGNTTYMYKTMSS